MIFLKKILYIGHSYHAKTLSTSFLLNILSKHFEVEIILDESWQGKREPDLSNTSNDLFAVIFFQVISQNMLKQLSCDNIIFFPMYDDCVGRTVEYWYPYRNIKIFNFSRTLHNKLQSWGFNTQYIHYYPKFIEVSKPNKSNGISIFFWQRTNDITWNQVKKIISNLDIESIHIHKAVDPGHIFEKPSIDDEKIYKITYSDWFDTKEDYTKAVNSKTIYIAPRLFEGIGFSFLEAMALGKIVIAPDNPTMNEYIRSGFNGYLYDLHNIVPIHIDSVAEMLENLKLGIIEGENKWERDKHKIVEFIEAPIKIKHFRLKAQYIKILVFKLIIAILVKIKKLFYRRT